VNEVRVERRLAAIVCADVVGYSRLIGADEAGTVAAWRAHREAILPIATSHRGRLVGTQGDGLLFEFASVVDAVAGAIAIQTCMAGRGLAESEDRRFRLRVGINLGDIIVEGGDILGDGVNVAARLEALADPGMICVSDVVREQVQGKLPVVFDDLGPRSVKNIARAVHAWRVRPAGSVPPPATASTPAQAMDAPAPLRHSILRPAIMALAVSLVLGVAALGTWLTGTWPWSGASRPAGVAIMVLPFESPTGHDQEYFSDGITEDIITALSKMAALANQQNLRVMGRSTSFSWKGRKIDVRQLGRELGITHALVGSVRREGGRLRISAELIDAWTGRSDWAERYDRDTGAVFDIQDEVTGKVVSTLIAMLDVTSAGNNPMAKPSGKGSSPGAEDPDERQRREEAEARARAAEARRREEEARRQGDRAPKTAPPAPEPMPAPSAPAPAPKAARPTPSVTAPAPPPPAAATTPSRAPRAVMRPAPEVYDLLLQARLLAAKGERPALLEARALLLRAVAREPNYVPLQMALADTYRAAYERRWEETDGAVEGLEAALRSIDTALSLAADAPMGLAMRSLVLAHLGRHDEAQETARRAIAAKDADAAVLDRAARTLVLVGDSSAALDVLARARTLDPVPSPAALSVAARALFLLGRDADAAKSADACLTRAPADRDCLEIAAAAAARLDKRDAARAALAKLTALDPGFGPETPRIRFAKSYRNGRDLEAIVEALRKAAT